MSTTAKANPAEGDTAGIKNRLGTGAFPKGKAPVFCVAAKEKNFFREKHYKNLTKQAEIVL